MTATHATPVLSTATGAPTAAPVNSTDAGFRQRRRSLLIGLGVAAASVVVAFIAAYLRNMF